MTGTVLLIALIHAIPVLLVGVFSKSKGALNAVAIVMAVIAVLSGNASFMIFDFVAIGLAYYFCSARMETSYQANVLSHQITSNVDHKKGVSSPDEVEEGRDEVVDEETSRQLDEMHAAFKGLTEAVEELADPGFMWRRAAEEGNPVAQFHLGLMYHLGEEVPKDELEAIKWYRPSAEQGDIDSQLNLGLIFLKGEGVPQDYHEAAKWLLKAADGGSTTAQYNLGVMYEFGTGVAWDIRKACDFYRRAVAAGHEGARKRLAKVEAALET